MSKRPINYTSREFDSIKESLVNYAKRYYANTYQDFNEASFGAMMLDLVSYVGDQLSFYTDYQANESFLDTAIELPNVQRLAKQMGYKQPGASTSTGICNFYILIPVSTTNGGPDTNYIPILKRGSLVGSQSGAVYTLTQDVDFTAANNEITVARVDSDTGVPTFFAIKGQSTVVSGRLFEEEIKVTSYERFLRLRMGASDISEIVAVVDSQGNEYFQVDYLTQDVVLSKEPNRGTNRDLVPFIMKTKPCPRRFVTEFDTNDNAFLQFGYGSADNLTGDLIANPADVVLDVTGRTYVSDPTFDPTNLIKTDKFGVVPENTTLTIVYRGNTSTTINSAVGTVKEVVESNLTFINRPLLNDNKANSVINSLEVENPEPILGDTSELTAQEIKIRAYASFASQNRAVTRNDYISLSYRMPSGFGKVKRVNIVQDPRSTSRNLNMYVLAESVNGKFIAPTTQLKTNLKSWLERYRMINDSVDILDGKIINYGIEFEVIAETSSNRFEVLNNCTKRLKEKLLNVAKEMGEPVYLTEIYKHLNSVPGVVDTTAVKLVNKTGGSYSSFNYEMDKNMSSDGRFLIIPADAVADVLFSDDDISGVIK
mgnify:FL=1|jgi:hypothetical protein|tara:strand:- start:7893 stop:9686 length:1794 start_codon:yes stop_codon:yes gene_type:complete